MDLIQDLCRNQKSPSDFFCHFYLQRGERMTKAEVKSMIQDADFNGDGRLDYEEVCRISCIFLIVENTFAL